MCFITLYVASVSLLFEMLKLGTRSPSRVCVYIIMFLKNFCEYINTSMRHMTAAVQNHSHKNFTATTHLSYHNRYSPQEETETAAECVSKRDYQ
jgi:hypothetical protein